MFTQPQSKNYGAVRSNSQPSVSIFLIPQFHPGRLFWPTLVRSDTTGRRRLRSFIVNMPCQPLYWGWWLIPRVPTTTKSDCQWLEYGRYVLANNTHGALRKDEPRPPRNVYPNLKAFDQSNSISFICLMSFCLRQRQTYIRFTYISDNYGNALFINKNASMFSGWYL